MRPSARHAGLVLAALAALYAAARLWRLTAVCFDGDEIFSVLLARENWTGLFAEAVRDAVHPPLFYVLLKLWTRIGGESLFWVRALPAAISLFAIPPLYLLCRDLGLRARETRLAIALAALNPFLIYYSQHARMYSLLFVLGLTSTWLCHRLTREDGNRTQTAVWLAVANIALVYTHYYGWVLIGTEWLYAAWRRRRVLVPLSLGICATALGAAPWMIAAAQAMRAKGGLAPNLDWVRKPGVADLIWLYVDLTGSAGVPIPQLAVAPLVVLGVVMAVYLIENRHDGLARFLAVFGLAPALLPFAASQFAAESVWGHRHLIFMAGPFVILVAVACVRVRRPWMRRAGFGMLAVWASVVVVLHIRGDDQKARWDWLAVTMAESEQASAGTVPVYATGRNLHYALGFYIDEIAAGRTADLTLHPGPAVAAAAAHLRVYRQGAMPADPRGHFWIVSEGPPRTSDLQRRACTTGRPVSIADRYERVSAIPVDCPVSTRM